MSSCQLLPELKLCWIMGSIGQLGLGHCDWQHGVGHDADGHQRQATQNSGSDHVGRLVVSTSLPLEWTWSILAHLWSFDFPKEIAWTANYQTIIDYRQFRKVLKVLSSGPSGNMSLTSPMIGFKAHGSCVMPCNLHWTCRSVRIQYCSQLDVQTWYFDIFCNIAVGLRILSATAKNDQKRHQISRKLAWKNVHLRTRNAIPQFILFYLSDNSVEWTSCAPSASKSRFVHVRILSDGCLILKPKFPEVHSSLYLSTWSTWSVCSLHQLWVWTNHTTDMET